MLRHLELKGSFGKLRKDMYIIICGGRIKRPLERGAHMPVQPCPPPGGEEPEELRDDVQPEPMLYF